MRALIEGDSVRVTMSRNNVFEWQDSPSFDAVIVSMPADTGDMWYFDDNGVIIAISPMSSDFVGVVKYRQNA